MAFGKPHLLELVTAGQLERGLEGTHGSGSGWTARCPAHDDDDNPGLPILTTASAIIPHLPAVKAHIGLSHYIFNARMKKDRSPKHVALRIGARREVRSSLHGQCQQRS